MIKYTMGFVLLLISHITIAQNDNLTVTIKDEDSQESLTGATVFIPELDEGKITNEEGQAVFTGLEAGKYTIQVSFVGYESVSNEITFPLASGSQEIIIFLEHGHEMEEVIITSTRSSRTIEDIPTRVEFIAGEELAEKGNMKPGDIRMLLNESTGIQTQQTSATSYNSSIRIQGLDGKYTQLLRDGLPLYSGFSGGLSLMQVAPLDLKQVEVIKGSASTLYGGGAIAGLVNLVTKKPTEEGELSFMLNGTSALGIDASTFYEKRHGKIGTTVFASYNMGTPYDPADIGLTAIPEFDRFTLNPRIFLYPNERTSINAGFNYINEERIGGNIAFLEGERNISNPYFERNLTDRISTQFQLDHDINEQAGITIKNSFNIYDRTIEVPDFSFSGLQLSSFSEITYALAKDGVEWVGGVNLWTDKFNQDQNSSSEDLSMQDQTIGAFVQNTASIGEQWTLETGFRFDYHSEYGAFPLPRLSLMFKPAQDLTFRLGGGLGYKAPTVFSEDAERVQFRNILPLDTEDLDAERSFGSNFDINYRMSITEELGLSLNTLFFYTQIQDPLVFTPIFEGSQFQFTQPDGYIDTRGVEVNIKLSYHDLKLFIGYTFADALANYNGEQTTMPLVAKHRLNNVLMYEKHDNFWIGLEAYYFSPQQLGDGSVGQAYWIVGLMTEKKFGDHFSVFLNFENFTDTRQTAFDTVFTGTLDDPQFRDIYAPVDGFIVNGGIKLQF